MGNHNRSQLSQTKLFSEHVYENAKMAIFDPHLCNPYTFYYAVKHHSQGLKPQNPVSLKNI